MALVGNTHLVAGGVEMVSLIRELLKREGIETQGNPDVFVREYQRFGIDEARDLRERASLRALRDTRIFIIVTPGMTNEAQNALLKTLEEPPANAIFFFVVSAPHMLLPTLRSRAQLLAITDPNAKIGILDAKAFLAAGAQKRLDMLKPLLEKDDDDLPRQGSGKAGKRDIGTIVAFLSSLERVLLHRTDQAPLKGIESIYRARKYLGDKGALVKPLLEQVALLMPRM